MTELTKRENAFLAIIKRVLSSEYFPIFTAVMFIANYYLGFDLVNIYIYGVVLVAMILLLDDLTPVFSQMVFLAVIASKANSPMYGESDYYTVTSTFVQIGCIIGVILLSAVYRFIKAARAGDVRVTPMFVSVILLSIVYILNGCFSEEHGSDDLLYGLILAASLLPVYMLLSCTVKLTEENIRKICMAMFIFSVLLVIELSVALSKLDLPLREWTSTYIRMNALKLGWGMWNNLGMLLVICIAPVMYLALKKRGGAFFIIWASFLVLAVICSTSRQAYIGGAIAYVLGIIYVLVKSKERKSNYVAFVIVLIGFAAIAAWLFISENGKQLVDIALYSVFNSEGDFTANGRVSLWKKAWENFKSSPILGVGFYAENMQTGYTTAMGWFPHFYHNTICQILGSCGAIGMVVYLFHRVTSVAAFFKNRSVGRTFIAIALLAYLIMGLGDNHMYYTLSGFIYPVLLVFVTNPKEAEMKETKKVKEQSDEPFGYTAGEDEFLDSLTADERKEFFKRFIGTDGGTIREYVIGGDNRRFFKDCFIYLGELDGVLSYSLMQKICTYSRKYDVK